MSNAIAAKTSFAGPALSRFGLAAIGHAARAIFWAADRLVAESRKRQAAALLMAMDDRQLKDLGIIRSDIFAHVEGRFGSYGRGGGGS